MEKQKQKQNKSKIGDYYFGDSKEELLKKEIEGLKESVKYWETKLKEVIK